MKSFFGITLGPFGIGMIAVVMFVTACLAASSLYEFSDASDEIKLRESLVLGAERMRAFVVDAETGQRGFVITGDDGYLDVYGYGRDHFHTELANLLALAPSERDDLQTIFVAATPKLIELQKVIDIRRGNGFEAARAQIATHLGKNLMTRFRELVTAFQEKQRKEIGKQHEVLKHASGWAVFSLMISLSSMFLWIVMMSRERRGPRVPNDNHPLLAND